MSVLAEKMNIKLTNLFVVEYKYQPQSVPKSRKQKEVDLRKNSIADNSDFVVDAKNIDFYIPF
jgi:hypothetical protein